MKRAILLLATGLAGAFVLCTFVQPINSTTTRGLLLISLVALLLCLFLLSRGHRLFRIGLVAGVAALGLFLLLPGRTPDANHLQARYLKALPGYLGTTYIWGGERGTGIDCSGLPRKALRDALFQEGIATFNPRLIRECIGQWWFDASASALSSGYRDYMHRLPEQGPIRNATFRTIQPGDVAITASGVHCLVYLGATSWIEADPDAGKVVVIDAQKSADSWFDEPMRFYRWTDFAN
ncbi:MAG TPA: NlpC/P60 family protein [Chthoniobacterales bacterium]|nr:NlpC/P60 family protein [Chthoniobacterales bacterium]